jgi:hypothetical protein
MDEEIFGIPLKYWLIGAILPTLAVGVFVCILIFLPGFPGGYSFNRVEPLDPVLGAQLEWEDRQTSPNGHWNAIIDTEAAVLILDVRGDTLATLPYFGSDIGFQQVAWIDDSTLAVKFSRGSGLIWRWHYGRLLHNAELAFGLKFCSVYLLLTAILARVIYAPHLR